MYVGSTFVRRYTSGVASPCRCWGSRWWCGGCGGRRCDRSSRGHGMHCWSGGRPIVPRQRAGPQHVVTSMLDPDALMSATPMPTARAMARRRPILTTHRGIDEEGRLLETHGAARAVARRGGLSAVVTVLRPVVAGPRSGGRFADHSRRGPGRSTRAETTRPRTRTGQPKTCWASWRLYAPGDSNPEPSD